MTLFLTSSPGGMDRAADPPVPCPLDGRNGFPEHLRDVWPQKARTLFLAASPDDFAGNERFSKCLKEAFQLSGLPIQKMDICDHRNPFCSPSDYDFLLLSGGHVPTQNAFFREIGLREALKNFDGIIMGISAGTMNCASVVYAQPELEGEAVDPSYVRFLPGLGLTDLMILPHFQEIGDTAVDGLHVTKDLLLPDSTGRRIYALTDGSYILVTSKEATLFGEAYLAENGTIKQICKENGSIRLQP